MAWTGKIISSKPSACSRGSSIRMRKQTGRNLRGLIVFTIMVMENRKGFCDHKCLQFFMTMIVNIIHLLWVLLVCLRILIEEPLEQADGLQLIILSVHVISMPSSLVS